ncbi:unnamed protein product [Pieris macdunnoughi]|uniref:Uncharacterized protein n=1 Tax=Pieris macdunnoughi TaxID=345717 RepID=A0A821XB95_9NEOP|nr:unnamed protein product [Pieris macdunnoughi]
MLSDGVDVAGVGQSLWNWFRFLYVSDVLRLPARTTPRNGLNVARAGQTLNLKSDQKLCRSLEITKWTGPTGQRCIGRRKKRWTVDVTELAGTNWKNVAQDKEEKWKIMEEGFTLKGAIQIPYH